jgi:hypothetical protein
MKCRARTVAAAIVLAGGYAAVAALAVAVAVPMGAIAIGRTLLKSR